LKRNHIEWEHISLYIYYQLSIVERAIQTVIDKIRTLIIEIQLSAYLWMELVKTAVYLKNRFPIKSLLDTTPWKSLHKEKSDFFNFRIIRSFVYYHNIETETDPNRRIKSDSKIRQTRLIGYGKRSSQYRVWNSINDKIEKITFIRIDESDYMITLEELEK
jgi:hypothetical protein